MSIKKTKETYPQIIPNGFTFSPVSLRDVQKEIMNPDVEKSSAIKSIPASILKQSAHIYLPFLSKSINHSLYENTFPDELKQSQVIPLYKKTRSVKEREL